MREFPVVFDEGIAGGLRATEREPNRKQSLLQALGLIPEDGVLQTPPVLDDPIAATGAVFPYPQVFKLNYMILVCDKRAIYTYNEANASLTLVHVASAEGCTWNVADFHDFVVMTNGRVLVFRDPEDGTFSEYSECEIPNCICLLNLNGQLIVGGPGVSCVAGFTGE